MANPIEVSTITQTELTLTTPRKQSITMDVSSGTGGDPYDGTYEVTPSEETQILRTAQKVAQRNIVINPIPSGYGRIEWMGTTLRVF